MLVFREECAGGRGSEWNTVDVDVGVRVDDSVCVGVDVRWTGCGVVVI